MPPLEMVSEFSPAGRLLMDLQLPQGFDSYRAYRFAWAGTPSRPPRVAAQARAHGRTAVYASWNGATGVAGWTVLAGPSADRLSVVKSAPREGLETAISALTTARYVAVRANDATGAELARSAVVRVSGRG